jgi:hypothetical protein
VFLAPRWRFGRGGDEGVTTVASKRSRHGGSGGEDDGVPATAACALVASLMAVQRWQHAELGSDSGRKVGTEFIL